MNLNKWASVIKQAAKRFYYEEYSSRASALAYTSLLAVVPLLSIIIFISTLFPFASDVALLTKNYVISNFIPVKAVMIENYLNEFALQANKLPLVSFLFLFITTIFLLITIQSNMNEIWQVKNSRTTLSSILLSSFFFIFLPFIVGFNTGLNYLLFNYGIHYLNPAIINLLALCLPIAVNISIFTLLNVFVPHAKVHWKNAIAGAVVSAILFEISRKAFVFYVVNYPSYELIYGVFAAIPIFLLWLYVLWAITLFGALVASVSANTHLAVR